MAGTDSRFDATKFRDGIRFAMEMGFPEDESKQITWLWDTERTFSKTDSGNLPFTWEAGEVVTEDEIDNLIVLCAVKFEPPTGGTSRVGGTSLGVMDVAEATVTMLDTDYDLLVAHGGKIPDRAIIDGNIYVTLIEAPPVGLFEVTVHTFILQAIDES